MGGALLQIYVGRNGSIPAITLNAGSGIKGLTIHYPEQFSDSLAPYSFTVKAVGAGAYVQNVQFVNCYDAMEFNGSDNYLAEYIMAEHIHRVFKAVNCVGGRIQHSMVRDEWDATYFPTFLGEVFAFSLLNSIPYEIAGCTNQEIFGTFRRASFWMASFTNSTVHTLQYSFESCNNGVQVNGIPVGGSVELLGSSMRFNQDERQPQTGYAITTAASDGDYRMISSLINGNPDTFLTTTSADCTFQNCLMDLGDRKVPTDGIKMTGTAPGVVRIENSSILTTYLSNDIANVSNNRLELVGNLFGNGFEYAPYQSRMQSTVNPASLLSITRIAHVANQTNPAVATFMNLASPVNSGMTLLTPISQYSLATKDVDYKQWWDSVTGYVPTGSPQDLLFEVTSQVFSTGSEVTGASINFNYYDLQAGQIAVSYKLPGGSWVAVTPNITLTGDGGYVVQPINGASNPYWIVATVSVPGGVFKLGAQIKLTVTGSPIFSYVTLQSTNGYFQPLQSPSFSGTQPNQAPTFNSNPFSAANAGVGNAYSDFIANAANDLDLANG